MDFEDWLCERFPAKPPRSQKLPPEKWNAAKRREYHRQYYLEVRRPKRPMTNYTDQVTCRHGHQFTVHRALSSVGRSIMTRCKVCGLHQRVIAGPPHSVLIEEGQ